MDGKSTAILKEGNREWAGGGTWLLRYQTAICRTVPFWAAFCFLAWSFLVLKPDFSWDDAEPEVLDQAWRMARGDSVYRDISRPPYAIPIYPPLYLACVAALLKLTGLSYLPARLLSLMAGLSIGWALVRLSRSWNREFRSGLWTACFLFLIPAFLYNVLRSHVQMLAVALSVWSLIFFLRNRRIETLVISPIFAALAFYTKQTQIALPLAMVLYLALFKRRWLLPYAATLSVCIALPFLVLQKITGGLFFIDVVTLARLEYNVLAILPIFLHHAGPIIIFSAIAGVILYGRIRKFELEPVDFYFATVLIVTLALLGRVGAHGQYVVEFLVATLIYLLRTAGLPSLRVRGAWLSIQVLLLLIYSPLFVFAEEGMGARAAMKASSEVYSTLRGHSGPILSQQGSFALFSRGGIYIQLFHFSGLTRAGKWDQSPVLNDVKRRIFSHVITEFPIELPATGASNLERFTPEMLRALRENYSLLRVAYPYYLYKPRETAAEHSP